RAAFAVELVAAHPIPRFFPRRFGPLGGAVRQDRKRDAGRHLDDIVAQWPFETIAAANAMPGGVDKWSLPDQREPKLASVEGKIGFFGITNCNAARTGALDKMAVNEGFIAGHQLHFALHQSRRQTCLLAAREIGPDGSDLAMGIALENVNPRALAFRPETRHARAGAERCRVNQVVG